MRFLYLSDLLLALNDLLDKREKALKKSATGKTYAPMLAAQRDVIAALPAALIGGKPLAAELGDLDGQHDGFGGAIWHMTEAYLRVPKAKPAVLEAAQRIRAAFIPDLDELRDAYATEADRAKKRRKSLKDRKADLEVFPVTDAETLYTWAKRYLDAGEKLDVLLSARADKASADRSGVSKARASAIKLLNRFRRALADEVAHNAKLPRDLDAQVFGYFDELENMRGAAASGAGAAKTSAKRTKGGKGTEAGHETEGGGGTG